MRTVLAAATAFMLGATVWFTITPDTVLHSQTPSPTATATQAPPTPVATEACGVTASRTTPPQRLNLSVDGSRSVQLPDGTYIINALDNQTVLFVCHVPTNSSIRFDYRTGCELSRSVGSPGGAAVLDQIAAGGAGTCPPATTTPSRPSPRPPTTGDGGLALKDR
jgi:hypothetical protein